MSGAIRVGCKVNLYLNILGVRPDGYHELETLFHPVPEPHDTLEITEGGAAPGPDGRPGAQVSDRLTMWCSDASLETPANIVAKACEAHAQATGFAPSLAVRLTKGIPHGAGLGGGSADAAAMLSWLDSRAGDRALGPDKLAELAAGLGADVPFFLMNRPAWAGGIGEKLTQADCDLSGFSIVVAVPPERVNTALAYKAWDEAHASAEPQDAKRSLTRGCPASMRPFCVSGAFLANSFETVVFRQCPAARLLKERLLALGAAGACLSGSGSAVFGLFRLAAQADAAASVLGPTAAVFSARL